MSKVLKKLDPTKRSFIANGKEYFIESNLSIARFHDYQILDKEAGFSMTFGNVFEALVEVRKLMNSIKFVDASVKLENLMTGMAKLEEKEHTLLKMCALYINTKEEDRGEITADQMSEKINDWKNEYEIEGFFSLALNSVSGYLENYKAMHQIISDKVGE